jgi:hypothetical protein
VEIDERARRGVDLLAAQCELGPAAQDDVQLAMARIGVVGVQLVVLLDDQLAGVSHVGVRPERVDPELSPHGLPLALHIRLIGHRFDVVHMRDTNTVTGHGAPPGCFAAP